jgi:glucose/arabinose dehydrogenase
MKSVSASILAIITALVVLIIILLYIQNFSGVWPAISPVLKLGKNTSSPITASHESFNYTSIPLSLSSGLTFSIYASNISNARDLELAPNNVLLVSQPSQGAVIAIPKENEVITLLSNLNRPHGIAFHNNYLYVAETNAVSRYQYNSQQLTVSNRQKLFDLPAGGNHWTRSILIKDDKLYTSIGSTCNVCREQDWRRTKVLVSNLDGSNLEVFSSGLRNAVFMTLHPQTKDIWATEMGRDLLGDNLPPDEINILTRGADYGWPECYGKNLRDNSFSSNASCDSSTASLFDLPAHSAPLGLSFVPDAWPSPYAGKLLVAFHGSWNRTTPTGYKIVMLDPKTGGMTDFISGWLKLPKDSYGRPVDVIFDSKGSLFISDDKANAVYKVTLTE